ARGWVEGVAGGGVGGAGAVLVVAADTLAAGALADEFDRLLGLLLLGAGDGAAAAEGDLEPALEAARAGAAEHGVGADGALDLVGATGGLGDHVGGLVGLGEEATGGGPDIGVGDVVPGGCLVRLGSGVLAAGGAPRDGQATHAGQHLVGPFECGVLVMRRGGHRVVEALQLLLLAFQPTLDRVRLRGLVVAVLRALAG